MEDRRDGVGIWEEGLAGIWKSSWLGEMKRGWPERLGINERLWYHVINNKKIDLFLFVQDHCIYKKDTCLKKR